MTVFPWAERLGLTQQDRSAQAASGVLDGLRPHLKPQLGNSRVPSALSKSAEFTSWGSPEWWLSAGDGPRSLWLPVVPLSAEPGQCLSPVVRVPQGPCVRRLIFNAVMLGGPETFTHWSLS